MGYVSAIVDYICFPHLKHNFILLERNGFNQSYVWKIMLINLLLTNALVGVIYYYVSFDSFYWYTPVYVCINMVITELLFTCSHMLLHYTTVGASLHVMHHCCKQASWSTNLIFHPVDMAIEFSGPVLSVICMHIYIWQHNTTFLLTVLLVHVWYALDHSALLKLPHTKHHSHVNTLYTIYVKKYYTFRTRELVKALIKKESNDHDVSTHTTRDTSSTTVSSF